MTKLGAGNPHPTLPLTLSLLQNLESQFYLFIAPRSLSGFRKEGEREWFWMKVRSRLADSVYS